ncbi:MAG: membrane protein insertion efficiency factor YidD [Planctomycetes bacterium]|nr:membrane protein insertion efficiency factor YidD [Planctomycetota bacterium]
MRRVGSTAPPPAITEREPLGEPPPEANERAASIRTPHCGTWRRLSRLLSRGGVVALVSLISAYQACVRPLLIGHCPFWPSCSDYAASAIARHGIGRGGWLSIKRLGRCRPFSRGGYDPVP